MRTSLLALLQLTDSSFPTGSFAHSFGLETYVQDGLVLDAATFERLLRAVLHNGIGRSDAVATAVCYRAAATRDLATVAEVDELLSAMKLPEEARQGSMAMGRQLLRNCRRVFPDDRLDDLHGASTCGDLHGHHASVFGFVAGVVEIGMSEAVCGFLHAHVLALVSAAVRLVPLGATDAHRVARSVHDDISQIAEEAADSRIDDMSAFTPALDIRSMQHEQLHARLFIS